VIDHGKDAPDRLAGEVLGDAPRAADPGCLLGADLSEREVGWPVRCEWARTADDVLWRRSRLGLRFNAAEIEALARHLTRQPAAVE
jgi:glycerol-3-phosphate dehydrogenase